MLADRNNGRSVSRKGVWTVYFLRSWLQFEKRSTIFAQFRNKFWNQMKDVWSMTCVCVMLMLTNGPKWPNGTMKATEYKSVKLNVEILVTLEYQPINIRQLGRNRGEQRWTKMNKATKTYNSPFPKVQAFQKKSRRHVASICSQLGGLNWPWSRHVTVRLSADAAETSSQFSPCVWVSLP